MLAPQNEDGARRLFLRNTPQPTFVETKATFSPKGRRKMRCDYHTRRADSLSRLLEEVSCGVLWGGSEHMSNN
jgi:hypothetical protein